MKLLRCLDRLIQPKLVLLNQRHIKVFPFLEFVIANDYELLRHDCKHLLTQTISLSVKLLIKNGIILRHNTSEANMKSTVQLISWNLNEFPQFSIRRQVENNWLPWQHLRTIENFKTCKIILNGVKKNL